MPGWKTNIAGIKSFSDLPANAQAYVRRLEEIIAIPSKEGREHRKVYTYLYFIGDEGYVRTARQRKSDMMYHDAKFFIYRWQELTSLCAPADGYQM